MRARYDAMDKARAQRLEFALETAPIDEFEHVQALVVGEREHRPKGSFEPLRVQAVDGVCLCLARRCTEHPRKCLAKAASRLEAMVQLQIDHALSFSDSG